MVGGRPKQQEQLVPANILLTPEQLRFIEDLGAEIRVPKAGGADRAMGRSEILRACIDALRQSKLDLAEVQSEAELAALLTKKLVRKR